MTKLPLLSGNKVCTALGKIGYRVDHQTGSHIILRNELPPYRRLLCLITKNLQRAPCAQSYAKLASRQKNSMPCYSLTPILFQMRRSHKDIAPEVYRNLAVISHPPRAHAPIGCLTVRHPEEAGNSHGYVGSFRVNPNFFKLFLGSIEN